MKMPPKSFTQLIFGTLAGIGIFSLLLPQISWAQTTDVYPSQDFGLQQNNDAFSGEENSDPFSGTSEQSTFGIFDLIHRATLGNNRSVADYTAEQDQNLDNAAAQFRTLQRQRILGQQQATPANPVATPQETN